MKQIIKYVTIIIIAIKSSSELNYVGDGGYWVTSSTMASRGFTPSKYETQKYFTLPVLKWLVSIDLSEIVNFFISSLPP